MQQKIKLPARSLLNKKISCLKKNIWGVHLKDMLRQKARTLPEYNFPIETEPQIFGETDQGVPIPIDTLGKWIFGTPGYKANIVVESYEDYVTVRIPDIEEVEKFILKIFDIL